MYTISIIVFALLILGVFVDYVTTMRERKQASKSKKIIRFQSVLFRGQRLLNGRLNLPLTVMSSVVCLERTLAALNGLIALEPTERRLGAKADLDKKLANFRALPATNAHFYSLLSLPDNFSEQINMLKYSILLSMTLKVEQSKGYVSIDCVQDELTQLDILNARLRSSVFGLQALQALEKKNYNKAKGLSDKAIALLVAIKCDNENVSELINEQIAALELVNNGITGVIDEKAHAFYNKFKESTRQEDESSDGLHKVINFGARKEC